MHSTTPPLHHSGLQHQKTPSSQPRLLSRALISPFTLGAVLIVFRVRKSRRGYERNETRGIVPRHNIVTSSLPTSQRATANFKSQHKNILHCWKLPTMGRAGQNIVSLNLWWYQDQGYWANMGQKTANKNHWEWDCGGWEMVTNYWK